MPSAFTGLNIAYTGLVAANAALNTTANNIANIETEGYTRQAVNQTAADAMRSFSSYGCVGAGVDTLGTERIRDIYYDMKYWSNNSNLGEYEKKEYYCKIIENYLTDQTGTNEIKGFRAAFSEYQAALETFSDNASETDAAGAFLGKAGSLCEYFNILYNSFKATQIDVNDEIKIKTDEINGIAQEIALLNQQINQVELGGNMMANELRDKRDLLLDELSAVIDIDVTETPIKDINTGQETGMHNYSVRIAGGQNLVNGYEYRQLKCVPRAEWQKASQNEAQGLYDVKWTDTEEDIGIFGKNVKGELKGLFEMRDGNNEEYFHGNITKVDTAEQTVTIEVTDDYLLDMSKSTIPLTNGQIDLGAEKFYYDNWEFKRDENGKGYYTFHLSENKSRNPFPAAKDLVGQVSKIGENVDYQGIEYYLEQMNEWVRDYASAANKIFNVDGAVTMKGEEPKSNVIFTGDNSIEGTQYELTVGLDTDEPFSSTDDGYFQLTAGNFNILKWLDGQNPADMITHTVSSDGQEKYDILKNLKSLATDMDMMQFRGCKAEDFLICLMGDSALNSNSAGSFMTVYSNIEETIANSRYSISGVDNDEEAANMVKFQNAYKLASKMISVLNDCYDRLITQTGV